MAKQIVFEMAAKVSGGFMKSMGTTSKEFSKLALKANELNQSQAKLGKFRELRSGLSKTRQGFNKAKIDLERLSLEMKNNPSKKLSQDYKNAQNRVKNLAEEVRKKTKAYKKSNEALKKEGLNTRNLAKEQGRLSKAYEKTMKTKKRSEKMINIGNTVKGNRSMRGLVTQTAVGIGVLRVPVKFAADDEESISDLKKIMKMESSAFGEFREELLKTTADIPMMNAEIYDIASAAGMAGIAQDELAQFTKDAAMMSKAFGIEASEAGDTMATWREAFKMNRDEVVNLMDQINYLGNEVNALPKDMAKVVREIGTLGGIVGFTEAETASLAGSLMASGNNADVTKTAIKGLYTTLSIGESATARQAQAYKKLGFDSTQVAKNMQKDAKGTMLSIMKAIKKLEEHEQTAILKDLFGKESIGVLADLVSNTELTERLMRDMGDKAKYAGSSLKEYEIKASTLNSQMIIVRKQLGEIAVIVGTEVIPIIKEFIPKILEGAKAVSGWIKDNPELVKTMFKLGRSLVFANTIMGIFQLGIGNLLIGGGKAANFFGTLDKKVLAANEGLKGFGKGVKLIGKGFGTMSKTIGSGIFSIIGKMGMLLKVGASFLVANPIVLGLGLIVAAGIVVYKNWDYLKEKFGIFVAYSKEKIEEWKESIAIFTESIKSYFVNIKETIMGALGSAVDGVKNRWEGLKDYFKGFIGWFKDFGKEIVTNHPIYKLGNFGIETGKKAWGKTKEFFSGENNYDIPMFAKGGIVSAPTLAIVGEGGSSESIIPHDNSNRSRSLWEATGRALGMSNNSTNNSAITINYNPTFYGTPPKKNIQEDLEQLVKNTLAKIQTRERRLNYQ